MGKTSWTYITSINARIYLRHYSGRKVSLWTDDGELKRGLRAKGYDRFYEP